MLDQGSRWAINPLFLMFCLKPESEVMVVHLPSLQARKFGSRSVTPEQMPASMYLPPQRNQPHLQAMHAKLPARARLWWQGCVLMSYGPGTGEAARSPSPHGPVVMLELVLAPQLEMPCSRLDLA